jgi:hypothetical protein
MINGAGGREEQLGAAMKDHDRRFATTVACGRRGGAIASDSLLTSRIH